MKKGTTPTLTFSTPFLASEVEKARVVFTNNNEIVLKKEGADCVVSDYEVTIKLTQEDTFKFECNSMASIQVRILHKDGNAYTSDPLKMFIEQCLDDEVI